MGELFSVSLLWINGSVIYEQEHHVTEKKEEQPTSMNAFELISMSRALDLGNLFEEEEVCLFS